MSLHASAVISNDDIEDYSVFCDKDKIEQVINNLIGNAIKFSSENKNIWINPEKKQGEILTIIKDEGTGIFEDEMKNLNM
jgi:signal transduction histidine kinase